MKLHRSVKSLDPNCVCERTLYGSFTFANFARSVNQSSPSRGFYSRYSRPFIVWLLTQSSANVLIC
jgi:hypothetical protein